MIVLLRAIARLVTFVLLLALALAGLALAVFALTKASGGVGEFLRLPLIRDEVGAFLGALEGGQAPAAALLGGLLAMLAGIVLLIGALRRPPEGTLVFEQGSGGRLAARKRPLSQVASVLAGQVRGVTEPRVRVKPKRRGTGGRIEVRALHARTANAKELRRSVSEALTPLADARSVRVRVRPEPGGPGARTE